MSIEERDIIRQQAGFICTALGDGWTVDPEWFELHSHTRNARVLGPNGELLFMAREKGRLVVTTAFPGEYADWPSSDERTRRTFADDTDPAKVARGIERDILPAYTEQLVTVTERVKQREQAEAGQAAARERLQAESNVYFHNDDTSHGSLSSAYDTYGTLRLSHDGTQATLDRLGMIPLDTMIDVLRVIKAGEGVKHKHTYQGQTLVHTHAGGDVEHGYFGHPEDAATDDPGTYERL